MNILISVCIFSYNRGNYLKYAIESVLSQYEKNIEIVVVDDGSTDDTKDIVNQYKHVNYYYQENQGAPSARNRCIEISDGKYLLWIGSDDILLPGTVKAYIEAINNKKNSNILYGNYLQFGARNAFRPFPDYDKRNIFLGAYLVNGNKIPDGGTLVKKDLYALSGNYDINFKRCNDYEFWTRAIEYAKFYHIKRNVYGWRVHDQNMTYNKPDFSYECQTIQKLVDKYPRKLIFPQFNWNNVKLAEAQSQLLLGQIFLRWGDIDRAIKCLESSIRIYETPKAYQVLGNFAKISNDARWSIFFGKAKQLEGMDYEGHDFSADIDEPKYAMPYKPFDIPPRHFEAFPGFAPIRPLSKHHQMLLDSLTRREITQNGIRHSVGKNKPHNTTLKILFVCHNFPPYNTAGAQLYAMKLARAMNSLTDNHVDILHPVFRNHKQGFEILTHQFEGLAVHRLFKDTTYGFERSVRHSQVYQIMDRLLSEHEYAAVHIHSLGQLSAVPVEIAKKHGKKIILTLHDLWFLCFFWFFTTPDQKPCSGPESTDKCARCFMKYFHVPNRTILDPGEVRTFIEYRKTYFKRMFDLADNRFAPSLYLAEEYRKFGYNGIEVSPLGADSCDPLPKEEHIGVRFGYVGNISVRKGANLALDAFEQVRQLFPEASLRIHGNSAEPQFLEYIKNRVEQMSGAEYFGPYQPTELPSIMSRIDILLVPSLWENYPLVVQEAFQHKVPVIASEVAGFPEMVLHGKNGLLFNVGDAQDLFEKMSYICARPDQLSVYRSNIEPVRAIKDDVAMYSSIYNTATPEKDQHAGRTELNNHKNIKVLFYFFKNVHLPILKPLYVSLKKQHPTANISFGYYEYAPQMRAGFTKEELKLLRTFGEDMYLNPQDFNPDVTFIADSVYPWVKGCGKLVHVGHGVLSKGQYYTDTLTARREEQADLVCVPGKHHQKIMRRIISKPVMATGMAKLDPLFSGRITRQSVLNKFGLPANKKYILFAPTFNDELSAIPDVKEDIVRIIPDNDTFLLIKLHGSTKAEYKQMYRNLPQKDSRVIYVDDLDITPFLALADVLVSDVSSAMMEFAALDKPVVLFNNPDWEKYANYNPDDIEFQWRDIGIETTSLEEMREAVVACLENPEFKSEKRKKYTDLLFANKYDGKAAERIVKLAMSMFVSA